MAMDRGAEVVTDDAEAIELGFTEAELTELALSADPDAAMDADAVPLSVYLGQAQGLLPQWYMPSPMARAAGSRWRMPVVLVIVAAFVIIEAFGLCSTFGQIVPA
jgi:DhnA family fructose-bisphosphate aldolase class Ia